MLVIIYRGDDEAAETHARQMLHEGKGRIVDLGKGYSALYHPAHVTAAYDHLHIYRRGAEILAINRNGSAHDGWHGVTIPRQVVPHIEATFPGIQLRKDRLIESADYAIAIARQVQEDIMPDQILETWVMESCETVIAADIVASKNRG